MDDLISRQALLDDIEELKKSPWFNDDNYFAIRNDALCCVVDLCIKKTPSAQKKGHWIYDSEAYPLGNPHGHYDCDQCGESIPHRTNYCPNCGSDMRGDGDG